MRRTLSPVPRPGTSLGGGGESTSVAVAIGSPLSKCNHDPSSSFASTQYGFFVLNLFPKTSSRSLEKQKPKGNAWRRPFFHFFLCFLVGVFLGFTPIVSLTTSTYVHSRSQAFSFQQLGKVQLYDVVNHVMSANMLKNDSVKQESQTLETGFGKFLIIVTTTPTRGYYLHRLAHTLKTVEPPLLWVVVEMTRQSRETSEILRKSGVMYRHLVCTKNATEVKDPRVHQRNVALSHIETHRLDGIVYFADDTNIYSTQLFQHLRQIRRFGTWQVAKLKKSTRVAATFVGPICNGTQVIGWHTTNVMRRYHAELSGFAFNSTILWDPKQWHRPSTQRIRHLDTVKDLFQASAFIEQVVEGETEMEGIPEECSEVLVWYVPMEIDQLSSSNATILDPLSISM
ncbi:putative 1,4-beta-D-xylan synthase [Helianthus annuus]|uniref:Glycosyltransferases n=2 Tax=Helianthus annuus TaxID=4232 RepID=A0A251T7U9_HELAN|nr:probable beta-1,4-xylosyltransferase IRX9H isoform X1 [Helianthus annuus]XP_021998788.1 probable beta-1,4-xylosyltransferase IRX9H isoform X1 [Helianthus annuus]KAF5779086.1 putative 1,4-beta-D-xylan synthase [Helianthus annuus]KAJ0490403.1 putative 1,4-beta-D-xylan synthase [Helianthus annuus]KAJ0494600.1 putative 1,4-beta-D-xylan synthase [Helianthus annuus]KAJ0506321.1 putative 1,4-beta-D-xylan synthase [Helianthus annuus]KAJ0675994.1 putative 1,4-beta-D-xylan synthase [Helianthus annuu